MFKKKKKQLQFSDYPVLIMVTMFKTPPKFKKTGQLIFQRSKHDTAQENPAKTQNYPF